jgi:hypothetical protein
MVITIYEYILYFGFVYSIAHVNSVIGLWAVKFAHE